MNLLDKIISGVHIKAIRINICAEVEGASMGIVIDKADISPVNNLDSWRGYSMTNGITIPPASTMPTEVPSPLVNVAGSDFSWSVRLPLLMIHHKLDADSGGKNVCTLKVSGAECIISMPTILRTLVFGNGTDGRHLKITSGRMSLLSFRFHPEHVKVLSLPLLELFFGTSAFRSWCQGLQNESDTNCRSYEPSSNELKSYAHHWKSQIRSKTLKAHPLDRKISVCHMMVLRAMVAPKWNYPCPFAVDSRALSLGIVEALDLKEGFSSQHQSGEPSDGESSPMAMEVEEEEEEGEEVIEEEVGAQLYISNNREIERCNALLYWLCNEWVHYHDARGGPISELDLSLMVYKFEILMLNGRTKKDAWTDEVDYDNIQASFIFSCYDAYLSYSVLLAITPLTPSTYLKPLNPNDLGKCHSPYLMEMSHLAVGADGQMESEQQPVTLLTLDLHSASLIDVEQLKDNVPYCSLLSMRRSHTISVIFKQFTRQNTQIALQQTGSLFVTLWLERFWAITEAVLLGTSDIMAFFSSSAAQPVHSSSTCGKDGGGYSKEIQLTEAQPSKPSGPICSFMPQLGISLDVKLETASILLIENVKSVNSALLFFHVSLDATLHSGYLKEQLEVDAQDVSLMPVIYTVQSDMASSKAEIHMNELRNAIEYIENYIEHTEYGDLDVSPLSEGEDIQKMRKVIMDGTSCYAELGYMVVVKEPLIHPTAIHVNFESHLHDENSDSSKALASREPDLHNEDHLENEEGESKNLGLLEGCVTPYVYVTLGVDVVELLQLSGPEALVADEYIVDAFSGSQILTATICNHVLSTGEGKVLRDPAKFGAAYHEYLSFCLARPDALEDINVSIRTAIESVEIASGTLRAKPRTAKRDGSATLPQRVHLKDPQSGNRCGHAVIYAHIDPAFLLASFLKIQPPLYSIVVFQVHVNNQVGTIRVNPFKNQRHKKNKKVCIVSEGLLFDIRTKNPMVSILAFIQGHEDRRVTQNITFDLSSRGASKFSLDGSTIYFSLDLVCFSPSSFDTNMVGGDDNPGVLTPRSDSVLAHVTKGTIEPPYPGGSYPGIPQKYLDYLQLKIVKEKEENLDSSVIASLNLNAKRGVHLRITDLDVIVLQRIFTNVMNDINVILETISPVDANENENDDKEVAQVVHLLRREFERADVDKNGSLGEKEVKGLLSRHITTLSDEELEVQVQRFTTVAGLNDIGQISLQDFTNAMLKVMAEGHDPEAIARARERALVEAFNEADADGNGALDRDDIKALLRSLTPSAITSEVEVAVDNFLKLADVDGSGCVNLDEFIHLCEMLSSGILEGRVTMIAGDFCCSDARKKLLGVEESSSLIRSNQQRRPRNLSLLGNMRATNQQKSLTLAKVLAMNDPSYRPNMIWHVIERELGKDSLPDASVGENDARFSDEYLDEMQWKLVRAFLNYALAREVWGFVIIPELCGAFLPRVSSIDVVDSKSPCVQMFAPLTMGNELYSASSPGHLRLISLPNVLKNIVVTGIRTTLKIRRSRNTRTLTFKVSGPCDVHVGVYKKFHGTLVLPSWLRRSGYRPTKEILEAEYEFPRRKDCRKRIHFVLFSRTQKSAGTVVLGGNEGIQYHYVVLISPASAESYIDVGSEWTATTEIAGSKGEPPFDSHTLRWRLCPSSVLSNADVWYRSINCRAMQRTLSINEIVLQVGSVIGGKDADSQPKRPPLFRSVQISISMLLGPIKLQLIDVSRAQTLGSRVYAPLLEVCLGTLPESTPVVRVCDIEGCTQIIGGVGGGEASNKGPYSTIPYSSKFSGLFCDRHTVHCSFATCEKIATHCRLNDRRPIFCSDHAGCTMVPFTGLESKKNKTGTDSRGPEMRLFWFHTIDSLVLGQKDILTMRAVFSLRVRYFNTLARQTEHLIEPWGVVLKAGSMTTDTFTSLVFAAPMHFGINVTTSFLSSLEMLSSMFSDLNPFLNKPLLAYGDLGLYSKWSFSKLDLSRDLQVRNRLGVPIQLSLFSVIGDGRCETLESNPSERWKRSTHSKRKSVLHDEKLKRRRSKARHDQAPTIPDGEVGKLFIPNLDAVKHLRVALTPDGFAPILDIELDFFSRKEQLFYLVYSYSSDVKEEENGEKVEATSQFFGGTTPNIRELMQDVSDPFSGMSSDEESEEDVEAYVTRGKRQPLISKQKGPVAVVIKFIPEPAHDGRTLDVTMEVSTNIALYNNTFSPILVNMAPESEGGSIDFHLNRGGLIPLPMQVLIQELLYITERKPGVRDEPLELSPYMFDVEGTPFSRHSGEVLKNCIAIHMIDPDAAEKELVSRTKKSIKTRKFAPPPVLWKLIVEPPYVIINALPISVRVEITQEKGFGGKPDLQDFFLDCGGVVDLPVLDLTNALKARVQLGGGGKMSTSFKIEAHEHLCRSELVKVPVKHVDPPGGPQFSISVQWESITMPRTIRVFAEVWVLNRTGVAMRYRIPRPGNTLSKKAFDSTPLLGKILPHYVEEFDVPSNFRLLDEAYYTNDVESTLMCKGYKRVEEDKNGVLHSEDEVLNGGGGEAATAAAEGQSIIVPMSDDCLMPPTMLHCPAKCLQVLPHHMAQDATHDDSFCLYDISCSSPLLPRCVAFRPNELKVGASMQIYWDVPHLQLIFPDEIHSQQRSCFHVLLSYYSRPKTSKNDQVSSTEAIPSFISFVCDADCTIYIALDADEAGKRPSPPIWLRRVGFLPINGQEEAVKARRNYVAVHNGFYFYRCFFRGGSRVLLGHIEVLVAVSYKKEERNNNGGVYGCDIADVSTVNMHSMTEQVTTVHNYWFVVPEWSPSIPVYSDGKNCCIEAPPTSSEGLPLPPLTLIQTKQDVNSFSMTVNRDRSSYALGSFVVFQDSTVLLCYDNCTESVPVWVTTDLWKKRKNSVPPIQGRDGKNIPFSCSIYTKNFRSGSVVRLGRRWAKGKPYFVFVHATVKDGEHDECDVDVSTISIRRPDILPQLSADAFWDTEANGPLVQIPLKLDWKGRSWSIPFSTQMLHDVGTVNTQCGVFGVRVNVLPGVFHVTREVSLYPPVVVKNDLDCPILVVPCLEPASKGSDEKQKRRHFSIRRRLQEYRRSKKRRRKQKKRKSMFSGTHGRRYTLPHNVYVDTEGSPVFFTNKSYVHCIAPGESVAVYDFNCINDPESLLAAERSQSEVATNYQKCIRLMPMWISWENDTLNTSTLPFHCSLIGPANDDSILGGSEISELETTQQQLDDPTKDSTYDASIAEDDNTDEPEVSIPIFYENLGESHLWLKQGYYENRIVKASCQLQSNKATVVVHLSDVSKHPPMRIDNLSSYRKLFYRIGGSPNIQTLNPMRWRIFVWGDDSRTIHVGVSGGEVPHHQNHILNMHGNIQPNSIDRRAIAAFDDSDGSERGKLTRQNAGLGINHAEELSDHPAKSVNMKPYTLQTVGTQPKLIPSAGEPPLLVECVRRTESLATMTIVFRDEPERMRLYHPHPNLFHAENESDSSDDDEEEEDEDGSAQDDDTLLQSKSFLEILFQAAFFSAIRINIAGCFITLVHSTVTGPKELFAITLDDIKMEKRASHDHVQLSLWHLQIDDLQSTAINPIVMQPMDSGFNSHRETTMTARPFCTATTERDLDEVLLSHNIQNYSLLRLGVKPFKSVIFVDGFVDVALLFLESLSWAVPEEDSRRELSSSQVVEGLNEKLTLPPISRGNIFLRKFEAELPDMHVQFHLGRKVTGLLGTKLLSGEEDEFPDDERFFSSPLMGGAIVEILKSLGDTFASASPVFRFPTIEISNYFGTSNDFLSMLVHRITMETVKQTYNIVGSIDLLGDPLTLCRRYVGGVSGFVGMASKGRPGQGAKELVKGFVGGTAGSVSKMAGAVDSFLSGLQTTDVESEAVIQVLHLRDKLASDDKRRHIGHGMKSGAKHFARSMVRGVTGVVTQPVHGIQTWGAGGLVLGVGKGVTGLVVAPVSGAFGATKYLVGGIDDTTLLLDAPLMGRRRPARNSKQGLVLQPIRIVDLDASIPNAYHALKDEQGYLVNNLHMASRVDADHHVNNKIDDDKTKKRCDDGFDAEDVSNVDFKKGKKKSRLKRMKSALTLNHHRRRHSESYVNDKRASSHRRKSTVY